MDIDAQQTGTWAVLIAAGVGFLRWAWLKALDRIELWIFASGERNRRREIKRQRRESSGPQYLPRSKSQPGVPQEFADEENTHPHDLIELERERRKERKSPGERAPRRGTHHD